MSILPSKKNSYVEASKKDYKYLDTTIRGEKVLKVYQDHIGLLTVIVKNNHDGYNIYKEYDPVLGYHSFGYYDYPTLKEAIDDLMSSKTKYTEFDPNNELDVKFEYDAKFNFNCVGSTYLKKNDHRSPGFNTYPHVMPDNFYQKDEGGRWKTVPIPPEKFDEHKRKYRIDNGQQRSMNKKTSSCKPKKKGCRR